MFFKLQAILSNDSINKLYIAVQSVRTDLVVDSYKTCNCKFPFPKTIKDIESDIWFFWVESCLELSYYIHYSIERLSHFDRLTFDIKTHYNVDHRSVNHSIGQIIQEFNNIKNVKIPFSKRCTDEVQEEN